MNDDDHVNVQKDSKFKVWKALDVESSNKLDKGKGMVDEFVLKTIMRPLSYFPQSLKKLEEWKY